MRNSKLASDKFLYKSSSIWVSLCSFPALIGLAWKQLCFQDKLKPKSTMALSHNGTWTTARMSASLSLWALLWSIRKTWEDGLLPPSRDVSIEKASLIWSSTLMMKMTIHPTPKLESRKILRYFTLGRVSRERRLTREWCQRCLSFRCTQAECLYCIWMASYFTWRRSFAISCCSFTTTKSQELCQGQSHCSPCSI